MPRPDDERSPTLPRPRPVVLGVGLAGGSSVVLLVSVAVSLARYRTVEFRETVADVVLREQSFGVDLSVDQALAIMRVALMATGALAAAIAVSAVFAARGDRGARVAMTVLAGPLLVTGFIVNPFLAAFVVGATVLLWTTPASDWFAGRPPRPGPGPTATPTAPRPAPGPTAEELRRMPPPAAADRPAQGPGATLTAPHPDPFLVVGPDRATAPGAAPGSRGPRPGRLVAGAVVAGVVSLGVAVLFGLGAALINTGTGREALDRAVAQNPSLRSGEVTTAQLIQVTTVLAVLLAVWALAAVVLAVLTLLGRSWARIALVGSAVVSGVGALVLALASPALIVLTAASALVVVLLLHPDVNAWYAGRPRPERPPGRPRR